MSGSPSLNPKIGRDEVLDLIVQAQEDERRRISFELHDTVTQWMTGALNRVRVCDVLLSESKLDEVRSEIGYIEGILKKGIDELRRVIAHLRSSPLDDLGLEPALRWSLEELQKEMNITCHFQKEGEPWLLANQVFPVYRIIQEALNNVRRHSEATEVSVRIRCQPEGVFFEVHDNGKGFEPSKVMDNTARCLGLLGMKERAAMMGGTLKIETKPGMGTSIILTVPTTTHRRLGED